MGLMEVVYLVLAIVFLVICAFFASAEIGFINLQRFRLKHMEEEKVHGAERVARIMEHPSRFLSVVLTGISFAETIVVALGTIFIVALLGEGVGTPVAIVVIAIVLLIFAKVIPKTIAAQHPERVALLYGRPIEVISKGLHPLVVPLSWIASTLTSIAHTKPIRGELISREELGTIIYTFVNYPLDPQTGMSSLKPVHPNESFPKTWQAVDKGLYVFRNQWKDARDIVLQVYANELMSKGHGQPDAAGIRLHGLGCDWTNDSPGKGAAYRWLQNVVVFPPDTGMTRATGRVTSWEAKEDGSGSVSINMDLVYKGRRGHDSVGTWPADLPEPGPVSGLRAVAADYSGKCGAPALFVFVDKIAGEGDRFWLWNLPDGGGKRVKDRSAKDLRVETGANTFTIHQDKATLQATFITPKGVEIKAPGTINVRVMTDLDKKKQQLDRNYRPEPTPTEVPVVAGAKANESYFVVMTLQEGKAPEVKVEKGEGLESVVCVGGRRIRFDGENVIIEDV